MTQRFHFSSLFFRIFILFSSLTLILTNTSIPNKCTFSPLSLLLEQHITDHPYKNINVHKRSETSNYTPVFGDRENYDIMSPLATGGFAKVFKAKYKPTGEIQALKIFVNTREQSIFNEIQITKELEDAPNILPLKDALKDSSGMIALVFPIFKMTDYKYLFYDTTEPQIKRFFYETLRTLQYAHERGIMHRDIKPQNVLMNVDLLQVKVIDWGHGAYYFPGKEYSVKVASMPYKGPELLLNYTLHDYSLDVWSTGCLFGALLYRRMPFFRGEDPISQLDAIAKVLGTTKLKQYANKYKDWMDLTVLKRIGDYPEVTLESLINANNTMLVTPPAVDLLRKMLVYDHAKRITVKDALNHPYFKEFSE